MNCSRCSAPIGNGLRFCENCGATAVSATHGTTAPSETKKWVMIGIGGFLALVLVGTVASRFVSHAKEPTIAEAKANVTPPESTPPLAKAENADFKPLTVEQKDAFINEGWTFNIPESEVEIVAAFGKPDQLNRQKVENKHTPGQMDEIVDLEYKGLRVGLYKVAGAVNGDLIEVVVIDPKLPIQYSLLAGASADRITKLLGKPSEITPEGSWIYSDSMSGFHSVTFKVADGRIQGVQWTAPID